jgi:hypothetical protein
MPSVDHMAQMEGKLERKMWVTEYEAREITVPH